MRFFHPRPKYNVDQKTILAQLKNRGLIWSSRNRVKWDWVIFTNLKQF